MKELKLEEMVTLRKLCAEGKCPLAFASARKKAAAGKLPAVKIAGEWHSSNELLKSWIYKGANAAARRILV